MRTTGFIAAAALSVLAGQVQAGVLIDPATVTGAAAIDPSGSQTVDQYAFASGSPTFTPPGIVALEALPGFRTVQTFTANGGTIAAGTNVIAFTDPTLPAVRLTPQLDAVGTGTGADINFNGRTTSGTSGITLVGTSAGSVATPTTAELVVDFGTYDATGAGTFTPLASGGVRGVGFTISNVLSGNAVFASFYNTSGTLLGTLKVNGNSSDTSDVGATGNSVGSDAFFGFQTADGSSSISRVVIDKTATSNGSITAAIDDFGFTPTPEPASLALVGGAAVLGLRRRSRHG